MNELFDMEQLQAITQVGKRPESLRVVNDRGHGILITTQLGDRCPVFVDMGSVLAMWSGLGAEITPSDARELGVALIEWAEEKGA